ncbi:7970_t:CDS:2, partial [Scutellospora calospora]
MEHDKKLLPRFQIFILGVMVFSEAISSTFIFPFIYFMIKDFNITDDDKQITSSFFLAKACSSILWEMLSDKYGRCLILLLGLLESIISCLLFGLSHSLWQAMLTRSISGFLNGNSGVTKSIIGEISNKQNEAKVYSIIISCWSMGFIVGPMIGGYLSNPVLNYPLIFANIIFLKDNPYLLPCLIIAFIILISILTGYFKLKEIFKSYKNDENVALLTSNNPDKRETVKKSIFNIPLASWFGLTTKNLALIFASMGITQIFSQIIIYPWIDKRVNRVTSYKYVCSIAIFINNSVRSNSLGKVNGIAQTAVAFMRSVGPLIGGLIWMWSLSNNLNFPFDVTSAIKLKSNNKLLQKSLELDIHRNDPEKGQIEEFLQLFYDQFINVLVKEDKLVIDLVRSRYKWFGLGGQDPDKIGAKKILESIDAANKLTSDEAKETKRKTQLILMFLLY